MLRSAYLKKNPTVVDSEKLDSTCILICWVSVQKPPKQAFVSVAMALYAVPPSRQLHLTSSSILYAQFIHPESSAIETMP